MILALALSAVVLAGIWTLSLLLSWPLWLAIVASALAVAGWAAFLLWRRWKAGKAAGDLEQGLESQAADDARAARPDEQEEIAAMQQEFQTAIRALKSSKLARGGKNALAVLPWYLIIGPPGVGKSTALGASGLKFPYLSSKRGAVRGVGGTRNCEWWLTNEAVLLDTAGRYATEEEDHGEWTGFLDLLARTRPREPVNGVVVAVSIADVGGESDEAAAALGAKLRARVDEVMTRLRLVVPVYVLFTKCDLLPGFVETFADLRKPDRARLWGFTLPVEEAGDKADLFRERFDELVGVIEARSLRRLAEERSVEARELVYQFPQQLDAVKGALGSFVGALFAENVYQEAPIFRGVYLTSGTQEGRLVDRVMQAMAKQMGIRPAIVEEAKVVEPKSYFLRDVFTTVMIPDRGLAHRSARATRTEQLRAWALAGAAGLIALLALAFPLGSFLANRELVSTTGRLTESVAARLKGTPDGLPPVKELEPLRQQLDLLVRHREQGAPLSMRLGLYQGNRLEDPVRKLYAGAVRRLVIDPAFDADSDEMTAFVQRLESTAAPPDEAEYARFYEKLKLHLLLTAPRKQDEPAIGEAEGAFIGRRIRDAWQARWSASADPEGPALAEQNARLFAKLLAEEPSLALARRHDLVVRERRVLARVEMAGLAIDRLAADVDRSYDVTLQGILGSPVPALRAGVGVRGIFTRRAYEERIKQRLGDPASLVELWVIGDGGAEGGARTERELARLRSLYFERYIDAWRRFIESIGVASGELAPLALLQDLSHGEPSPYARIFRAVGSNASLAGAAGAAKQAGAGFLGGLMGRGKAAQAAATVAGRARVEEEKVLGPEDVERALGGFASFGYAPEPVLPAGGGAPAKVTLPVDLYQEQLAAVREALQLTLDGGDGAALSAAAAKARNQVQTLINAREVGWRPRLKTLLLPPIDVAEEYRSREEVRQASDKWCSEVALWYRTNLAGKYPFVREAREDAAIGDMAAFFRPGTGMLWKFYDEQLARHIRRAGRGFQLVRSGDRAPPYRADLLTFLRRAQDLTAALFPPGSADPSVVMTVRVRPTPGIAKVVLELEGQQIDFRNGPDEWIKIVWPGGGKTSSASLRVRAKGGADESLVRDGDWAVFRLLEAGKVRTSAGSQVFTIGFPMRTLGAEVAVDFRPARSETPFFAAAHGGAARFLEPFRNLTLPLSIGGPPCIEGAHAAR